jgi:hypothetical protein
MAAAIAMVRKQKLSPRDRDPNKVDREQSNDKKKLRESIEICIKVNHINPKPQYADVVLPDRYQQRKYRKLKEKSVESYKPFDNESKF